MWSLFTRDPCKDFGYEINEMISNDDQLLWILHKGKKKLTGETVSIFRYECKPNEESYMELAKNSLKRLKTLRHPSILTYMDSLETDKYIIIVTEYVEPLHFFLKEMSDWSEQQKESAISWGIYSVAKGLCFLNNDCKMVHGNLSISSIFVNNSSDWKIFNLEYLTNIGTIQPTKSFCYHKIYTPPEVVENNIIKSDKQIDSWGLSCLIWEIFNSSMSDQNQLKNTKKLPKKLVPLYLMLNKNFSRCLIQDFLDKGEEKNGYFKNTFIDTMNFLEEIQIKDSTEKNRFFSNLNNLLESFPVYFCKNKILSFVVNSFKYGEANCHSLDLLIKIGKMLDENEYQKEVTPSIVKLFTSKDRSIRSKLLKEIEEYINFTPENLVNEQIFPYLMNGFLDSNPVIREQTVKSIFHLAPKLNNQNLNDEVLKHFSRIQIKDPEGGIRTNTIICLGKIASYLQPQTRQNVMLPLFLRSFRDPFPPSRISCIQSLCATQNFFTLQDCTTKIMPALCLVLMDPEKQVRDQAFTTLKNFIHKIERFSENPSLIEQMESEINKSGSSVSSKFTSSLSWAVSSLAAKLARTKLENTNENHHSENDQQINQTKSNQHKFANQVHTDISLENDNANKDSKDNVMKISNSNNSVVNSDGWDEDNWEGDLLKEFQVNRPQTNTTNVLSTLNKNNLISQNDNNDDDVWDDDIGWGNIGNTSHSVVTAVEKSVADKSRIKNLKSNKRGPMKLGAQKLKRTFD